MRKTNFFTERNTEKDITGQRFSRLVAIRFDHYKESKTEFRNGRPRRYSFWLFRCDCGKEIVIRKSAVTIGHYKSCNCLLNENLKRGLYASHRLSHTRFYRVWKNMHQRCFNKRNTHYKDYGGRGVLVIWPHFNHFKRDMYESYLSHCEKFGVKNTSIDRINVDGHYEKGNCRWATTLEQSRNKRPQYNKKITPDAV